MKRLSKDRHCIRFLFLIFILLIFFSGFSIMSITVEIQQIYETPDGQPGSRNEIYVGSGKNFTSINDAIQSANVGDTIIIGPGTYKEQIVLEKRLNLTGSGIDVTIVDAIDIGVALTIKADGCIIEGFTFIGGRMKYRGTHEPADRYDAIIVRSSNNGINECKCTGSGFGIHIYSDHDFNKVSNCTLNNNGWSGCYLDGSMGNIILNNKCSENENGIYLQNSYENYIINNTCVRNSQYGIKLLRSNDNILINNTCQPNSNYGIYSKDSNGNRVTGNSGTIFTYHEEELYRSQKDNYYTCASSQFIIILLMVILSFCTVIFIKKYKKIDTKEKKKLMVPNRPRYLLFLNISLLFMSVPFLLIIYYGMRTISVYMIPGEPVPYEGMAGAFLVTMIGFGFCGVLINIFLAIISSIRSRVVYVFICINQGIMLLLLLGLFYFLLDTMSVANYSVSTSEFIICFTWFLLPSLFLLLSIIVLVIPTTWRYYWRVRKEKYRVSANYNYPYYHQQAQYDQRVQNAHWDPRRGWR